MQATQTLKEEHRIIERLLKALHTAAQRLSVGDELRPAFFINSALFIKNFADGCHHHKEEGVLFLAMNQAGMPNEGSPIGVMLEEHDKGRAYTHEMQDAAQKWEKGDLSARAAVIQNALGYVALLRQHIYKEDNILYPMAERLVPADRQQDVDAEFDRIQKEDAAAGINEKYFALVEVLEKESLK